MRIGVVTARGSPAEVSNRCQIASLSGEGANALPGCLVPRTAWAGEANWQRRQALPGGHAPPTAFLLASLPLRPIPTPILI